MLDTSNPERFELTETEAVTIFPSAHMEAVEAAQTDIMPEDFAEMTAASMVLKASRLL